MSDEGGEKTEEPTQKRIDDSRRKGQVWKSKDLTGVAVFLVGLGTLKVTAPTLRSEITKLFMFGFDKLAHPQDLERATYSILLMAVTSLLIISIPIVVACAIVGGLTEFLQVGSLFSAEALMPKLDKLNPLGGLKNMFSKKQLVELFKSTIKMYVTGNMVYGVIRDSLPMVVATVHSDADTLLNVLALLIQQVAIKVGLVFAVFAIFDVWWQRRVYMKQLMMSKDEVKREYKESEGDPHHKAKRKELHHEILSGAQVQAVKKASVVVTNPDHVAVALEYDREKDAAPKLIAKGIDSRAELIKQVAKDSDVPLLRNVPLAHALLRIEVGEEIPEELYDAVAEVLNFVYGLQQATQPVRAAHAG